MTVQEYFGEWSKVLDLNEANRIMRKLSASGNIICPQVKDVFKAFRYCPLKSLRVVIIGQDPYNNFKSVTAHVPVATGIAFANSSDTSEESYSPSLEILRESVIDYTIPHGIVIFDPSLEKWEEQGVLLLNAALTCEMGKPGSHLLLWRPFISHFLSTLSSNYTGIVYVLMGSVAQSFEPYICKETSVIIRIRHPSWYARTGEKMPHSLWRQINDVIYSQEGRKIEWYNEY